MNTKVSVIIPCYNEPEEVFRRSIDSVIGQTLDDIQIIIILDNPDNIELKNIILEYQAICDKILLLTPDKNLGRGLARNLGISHAKGDFIAIHDADDIDTPSRLEEQSQFLEQEANYGVVFSGLKHIDNKGNEISSKKPLIRTGMEVKDSSVLENTGKNHPTMMIKTDIIRELLYKNLDFCEDIDLWIRLYQNKVQMGYLDTIHTEYLSPESSDHSEYYEKMISWKLGGIKALLLNTNYLATDPLFYKKIAQNLYLAGYFYIKSITKGAS